MILLTALLLTGCNSTTKLSSVIPSCRVPDDIATGLYVGESMYNDYKDTPLAKKAYNLAEMKLNELLDEKLNESGAENGNSKK